MWVFWVHASNAARFEQSFRDIAACVKISGGRNQKAADMIQLVHDWLRDERKGKWVLILDNMDDAGFLVEGQSSSQEGQTNGLDSGLERPLGEYIPQCQNGSILITTRSRSAALKLVEEGNVIPVEPMDKAHAMTLLKKKLENVEKKLGIRFQDEGVAELAAALECMPLAIVQAAAYISERAPRYSVQQYLKQFQESDRRGMSLLDREGGQLRRDREAKNSIIITWHISFNHIRQTTPSAAELLSLMSFFDRQGIPEALLGQRSKRRDSQQRNAQQGQREHDSGDEQDHEEDDGPESIDKFEDDIIALRNFSFISVNADGTSFEMHSLVQLAIRKWLEDHGQLERWRQQFIRNLCVEIPTGEYKNWTKCQELFPHAKSAVAQQPQAQSSLRDWASILYKAAWYAYRMGNGVDAEKMSVEAMNVLKKIHGQEHRDSLNSMAMVGLAYKLRGLWDAAEELEVQVMETRKKKLGADHPDTLISMANLASTYRNQGRWDAAEELDVQVMEMSKKKLGADHPDTLTNMANLASTLWSQGRWDAAEELDVQVMETRKKKLGAHHPDTLTSMNNLAYTWKKQGRDAEAVGLMRESVPLCERILGAGHPHFITYSNSLARWEAEQATSSAEAGVAGG
jgi:tetratricopeptide (TPR) repeat protein